MARQDCTFASVLLLSVIAAPCMALASNKIPTAILAMDLRSSIDGNIVELKKMFPNLQGAGTSPRSSEVLLTIFKQHSTPETEQEDADAEAKLLGVPVRITVIPAKLERQSAR